ncbi:uncharacterized protein LOC130317324 [Hyla sarda]|uniref:uncharacterized protein LOC130317324 n=1 Tax=Hyla sarda TaxID=327740 RepID=UPI0024C262C3|nr:uncharacterized protein LOC130317324 [Hyla sarda]
MIYIDLDLDLHRFFRNIRLKAFFDSQTCTVPTQITTLTPINTQTLGIKIPSRFTPPRGPPAVETFIDFIKRDISSLRKEISKGTLHYPNNFTSSEIRALGDLQNDKAIIIKPADKGGAIVVQDTTEYIREIHSQLNDTSIYRKLDSDPVKKIEQKILECIDHYLELNIIDSKTHTFLRKEHPITPVLYTLPKIHKNLQHPPGRPIVASTESVLSPLSITLEKILTPLIKTTPSFLLDTTAFIQLIHGITNIPPDSILVTLDVNSLYTSIKHEKGLHATKQLLINSAFTPDTIDFCTDILELVLHNNYFLFQDDFFLQIQGTAMGSNMAPPYANAYMAWFEAQYIYPDPAFQTHSLVWKRYIDDIFCIWKGPLPTLQSFHEYINSIWPELQFTIHYHSNHIDFLDTTVIVDSLGQLTTDLYTKPTDRNNLLLYTSYHPKSTIESLPRSQFHRVKRIVSNPQTQQQRIEEMSVKFRTRGYPERVLAKAQQSRTPRSNNTARIPFVHTYHPFSYKVHGIIRKHWPLLHQALPNVNEFKDPFMPCFRRPRNLRDRLVRADIGSANTHSTQTLLKPRKNGTFPCLHCIQCNSIIKGDRTHHPRSGESIPLKGFFTCDTNFVIYLLKCPCGLAYVGETTQKIRDRISQHKSTIRRKNLLLPVPHHFDTHNHTPSQLRFQVLEQIHRNRRGGNRSRLLKLREAYWIHRLQTLEPHGLNREYDITNM